MVPTCCSGGSGVPATTLLDPDETASPLSYAETSPHLKTVRQDFQITPILAEEVAFRHSGWHRNRRRVWRSMVRTLASSNRLDRFANCGSGCVVQWSPERKEWRLSANYCRDRLCQPCGRARSRQVEAALRSFIGQRPLRFATLTLRHNPNLTLQEQIKRLYVSFSTLRRRSWWKDKVRGGVAILEVKIGKDQLWHPHLHLLLESAFLPQKGLSHEWYAVTGDSYIVDVRKIDADQKEITYVCSYVGKPLDSSIYAIDSMLDNFAIAIKGKRLILPFGTWAKLSLENEIDDGGTWQSIGPLWKLIADAATDPHAQSILNLIQKRQTAASELSLLPRPRVCDDS